MAEVRQIAPLEVDVDVRALLDRLHDSQYELAVFDERVIAFVSDLSRRLRRHPAVAAAPALGALAYWIRPSTVARLRNDWARLVELDPHIKRVPRGVVFHLPPTNVDTLFVYSWLLSALTGNANVVRLSESSLETSRVLMDVVNETLAAHPVMAATTALVSYGHQRDITAALSDADVRVIWGGDETVATIRAVPAGPHTRDLAFPDRYSFSILDSDRIVSAAEDEVAGVARRFFNDAYWFDQLGCASPRLIVWNGDHDVASRASERFRRALRRTIVDERHPATSPSATLAKLVHASDMAARGSVSSITWDDNDLTSVTLTALDQLMRDSPGGGLFYEMTVASLDELVPFVKRKDQTVTSFGIAPDVLNAFIDRTGSRGIERIVDVGQALTFGRYWDGVDLLTEFTRCVSVEAT